MIRLLYQAPAAPRSCQRTAGGRRDAGWSASTRNSRRTSPASSGASGSSPPSLRSRSSGRSVEGPLVKHLREIAEGKRPVPTTKARRHHFVPSFALSKFATPQKRDGVLFQLDTKSGQPKKTTPEKSCFVEELYTQEDETGTQDRVLEAFFSVVENYAAQAFERFLGDPTKLSDADRQTLAYYLSFQYQRTPVVLEHSAQTQQAMMAVMVGLQSADAESFRERHRPRPSRTTTRPTKRSRSSARRR